MLIYIGLIYLDGGVMEIDKEIVMCMEVFWIIVLIWLESLFSLKVVYLKEKNYMGFLDDLLLGNGVFEMCDEEDVVFDY